MYGGRGAGYRCEEKGLKLTRLPLSSCPFLFSHIDSAWLWPFSVTQQKVARSWSTQVRPRSFSLFRPLPSLRRV